MFLAADAKNGITMLSLHASCRRIRAVMARDVVSTFYLGMFCASCSYPVACYTEGV